MCRGSLVGRWANAHDWVLQTYKTSGCEIQKGPVSPTVIKPHPTLQWNRIGRDDYVELATVPDPFFKVQRLWLVHPNLDPLVGRALHKSTSQRP